jgi:hypothetical protein
MPLILTKALEFKRISCRADFLGSRIQVFCPASTTGKPARLFTETVENDVSKGRDSLLSV